VFVEAHQSPFRIPIEARGLCSVQQNPPESAGVAVKLAVSQLLGLPSMNANINRELYNQTTETSTNGFLDRPDNLGRSLERTALVTPDRLKDLEPDPGEYLEYRLAVRLAVNRVAPANHQNRAKPVRRSA
jgi:hypothetical protein